MRVINRPSHPKGKLRAMAHRFHVPSDEPAFYHICVLGSVDERLMYKLGDTQAERQHNANGEEITFLKARFQDQAALFGVLIQLYNRGYCLVTLERIDESTTAPRQALNNK